MAKKNEGSAHLIRGLHNAIVGNMAKSEPIKPEDWMTWIKKIASAIRLHLQEAQQYN